MSMETTLSVFRAIGEETRLRIMALLLRGDLTVSEITSILGQSQPRVSRHLKILAAAGLAERHREGAWMFYRAANLDQQDLGVRGVMDAVEAVAGGPDRVISRDIERFHQSRQARAAQAAKYFQENAKDWDRIRRLHIPEADVEARLLHQVGEGPFDLFVDLGAGSGRMLELFADHYRAGIGYDLSHDMLAIARAKLEKAGVTHAQLRHGDLFSTPLDTACADVVCIHHVLHYLASPEAAVREAARLVRPGGTIIIADFAPHELEFLREDHAHRRLGFADDEVREWCSNVGLNINDIETLMPKSDDKNKLTVKIWSCGSPAKVRRLHNPKVN